MRILFLLLQMASILFLNLTGLAQPPKEWIQVVVTPDRESWTYQPGERPEYTVTVLKNSMPLNNITVSYEYGPELVKPVESGTQVIKKSSCTVKASSMDKPGFQRLTARVSIDGKEYSSFATVGFTPEKIEPTTSLPDDFRQFWANALDELARIPVAPVLTLLPEKCTDLVDVYHVRLDNISGKIYGILCKPKNPGKYPALLHVPGAGIRPYEGDASTAAKGVITFQIGIHGIPVNLPASVYADLASGPLRNYQTFQLDDRDNFYYKRVYLGCVRAVDFLTSLPEYDGQNLAVQGGSQGGALSVITASLDKRVKFFAAFYPALSDLTGYLHGRAGGWPHLFRNDFTNKPDKVEVSKYYDVVNFARFLEIPGWFSWGFNDNVCPPTSMYAAYNVITAPKELHLFQETRHWMFPEQRTMALDWLFKKMGR